MFWLNNKKRNLKILIAAILVILFIFAAFEGAKVMSWLNGVKQDSGINFDNADETYLEDETDFEAMSDIGDATSINDLLFKWATNGGEKLSSSNIINVMLFGTDNYNGADNTDDPRTGARSDTMILVSLNKKTQKITLVSFLRDSYTYMNIDGNKRFFKINAAYNWGGPATVVKIIEDNYKIAINKYVCVDFDSFPKIIDSLGGVTVDVEPYEAKYTESFFDFPMVSGKQVTLTGQQALGFSRIRKSDTDGDISRSRRQRSVIMAMIKSAKDASASELSSALDNVFPNIRTNYSKAEILSIGSQALLQGWADYEINQITSPAEGTSTSATIDTNWVWVIDYPLEASAIQQALYGTTNIVLDSDRVSALKMLIPKTTKAGTSKNNVSLPAGETASENQSDTETTSRLANETTTVKESTTIEKSTVSASVETTAG